MMLAHDRLILSSAHRLGGELGDHYVPDQDINHHCSTDAQPQTHSSVSTSHHLVNPQDDDSNKPVDPKQAAADAALKRASQPSP